MALSKGIAKVVLYIATTVSISGFQNDAIPVLNSKNISEPLKTSQLLPRSPLALPQDPPLSELEDSPPPSLSDSEVSVTTSSPAQSSSLPQSSSKSYGNTGFSQKLGRNDRYGSSAPYVSVGPPGPSQLLPGDNVPGPPSTYSRNGPSNELPSSPGDDLPYPPFLYPTHGPLGSNPFDPGDSLPNPSSLNPNHGPPGHDQHTGYGRSATLSTSTGTTLYPDYTSFGPLLPFISDSFPDPSSLDPINGLPDSPPSSPGDSFPGPPSLDPRDGPPDSPPSSPDDSFPGPPSLDPRDGSPDSPPSSPGDSFPGPPSLDPGDGPPDPPPSSSSDSIQSPPSFPENGPPGDSLPGPPSLHLGEGPPSPTPCESFPNGLLFPGGEGPPEDDPIFNSESPLSNMKQDIFMEAPKVLCHSEMSCENRCTQGPLTMREQEKLYGGDNIILGKTLSGTRVPCYCDRKCILHGDCCPDYFSSCLGDTGDRDIMLTIIGESSRVWPYSFEFDQNTYTALLYDKYGSCAEIPVLYNNTQETLEFLVVSRCPFVDQDATERAKLFRQNCEEQVNTQFSSHPASHRWFPLLIFRNVFCALCHGFDITDIIPWHVVGFCHWPYCTRFSQPFFVTSAMKSIALTLPRLPRDAAPRYCSRKFFKASGDDTEFLSTCRSTGNDTIEIGRNKEGLVENSSGFKLTYGDGVIKIPEDLHSKWKAMCTSVFQPVDIESIIFNLTASSIFCALCSGLPITEVPRIPTCTDIRMRNAETQVAEIRLEAWYDSGKLRYSVLGNASTVESSPCSVSDPVAVLLDGKCAYDCSEENYLVSDALDSNNADRQICALQKYVYKGSYEGTAKAINDEGQLVVRLNKRPFRIVKTLVEELTTYQSAFLDLLLQQWDYKDIEERLPVDMFQSVRLSMFDNKNEFEATHVYPGRLASFFKFLGELDQHPAIIGPFLSSTTEVKTYEAVNEVCPSSPFIQVINARIIYHDFDAYVYVGTVGSGCFFEMDKVAFRVLYNAHLGRPTRADYVVLCWTIEMALNCKIPPPSDTFDRIIDESDDIDENIARSPSLQFEHEHQGSLVDTNEAKESLRTSENAKRNATKDSEASTLPIAEPARDLIISETQTVRISCFSVCIVGSALSGTLNAVIGSRISLPFFTLLSFSQISLMTSMILYVLEAAHANIDEKLMGILSQASWTFVSGFLVVDFLRFDFRDDGNTNDKSKRPVKRWVLGVVGLCALTVFTCVVADEASSSHDIVGYSSENSHILWMRKEVACYIYYAGVVGAAHLSVIVKLILDRLTNEGSETVFQNGEQRNGNGKSPLDTAPTKPDLNVDTICTISYKSSRIYFVCQFGLLIIALLDYADNKPGLWLLLFSLIAFTNGLYLLGSAYELYTFFYYMPSYGNGTKHTGSVDEKYAVPSDETLPGPTTDACSTVNERI